MFHRLQLLTLGISGLNPSSESKYAKTFDSGSTTRIQWFEFSWIGKQIFWIRWCCPWRISNHKLSSVPSWSTSSHICWAVGVMFQSTVLETCRVEFDAIRAESHPSCSFLCNRCLLFFSCLQKSHQQINLHAHQLVMGHPRFYAS